jgi:hypothetical protein
MFPKRVHFPSIWQLLTRAGTQHRRYSGQGQMRLSSQTKARASENSTPRYVEKVPFVTGKHQK